MDYTVPQFEFGGHKIDVVVKELPQTMDFDLEQVIASANRTGRSAQGTAKLMVVQRGVQSIKVDNKIKPLWRRDKDGDQEFVIPNLRHPETRVGIIEELVRLVVEYNDQLAVVEPFSEIFGSYLPDDEQEAENPTAETGLSTGTSTPDSGGETPPPGSPPS